MQQNQSYKIIFHIDMNCFFASCEIAQSPELENKPIVIARNDVFRKSIILTASYEARKYGIFTTMLVKDAILKCPQVIVIEPHYDLYSHYSHLFFDYLYSITNKVEPMSIDEGFLDVTEVCKNISAIELANKIQSYLYNNYKLPCSIGIAPNKFLAKMASDMKKPMGITVLRKREVEKLLWPLPIEDMMGIGKKTSPRLHELGINTIGDILKFKNTDLLEKVVGKSMTEYMILSALGNGSTNVVYENNDETSSVSNSYTFDFDELDLKVVYDTYKIMSNSVAYRLEKDNLLAHTIGIQIKYNDFSSISRSKGLHTPTNDNYLIFDIAKELFDEFYDDITPIRLVGVFANRLVDKDSIVKQYTIFDDFSKIDKEENINKLLTQINNQYGNIINKGIKK